MTLRNLICSICQDKPKPFLKKNALAKAINFPTTVLFKVLLDDHHSLLSIGNVREKEIRKQERRTKWWAHGRKGKKERKKKNLVLSMDPTIFNLSTKRSLSNVI